MRVPVLVGHAEAVWVDLHEPLSAGEATEVLRGAPGIRLEDFPTPGLAAGTDDILVGRIREDPPESTSFESKSAQLALLVVCDNLRKGAALNAIQIAELLLERRPVAA